MKDSMYSISTVEAGQHASKDAEKSQCWGQCNLSFAEKTAGDSIQAHVLLVLLFSVAFALPITLRMKIILTLGQCHGWIR